MTADQLVDIQRRFSGVRRLYGEQGLACLQQAHVLVIGIGGVGSWAVEALARNAGLTTGSRAVPKTVQSVTQPASITGQPAPKNP